MSPPLKTIFLGAVLATATPIAHNATLPHQNTVSLATILPDGIAPVFMAQVPDPAAEIEKCHLGLYLDCMSTGDKDCGPLLDKTSDCYLQPLLAKVVGLLPPDIDLSSPITIDDSNIVIDHGNRGAEAKDTRSAPAPALERRQRSLCPKSCAAWAAIPPFGVWFGVCVADCNVRCNQHGHCP